MYDPAVKCKSQGRAAEVVWPIWEMPMVIKLSVTCGPYDPPADAAVKPA